MTTTEMIALAKESLGTDITEEQAQAYLDGKEPLPDALLEATNGGLDAAMVRRMSICQICGKRTVFSGGRYICPNPECTLGVVQEPNYLNLL